MSISHNAFKRTIWKAAGTLCLVIGLIGIVVPLACRPRRFCFSLPIASSAAPNAGTIGSSIIRDLARRSVIGASMA